MNKPTLFVAIIIGMIIISLTFLCGMGTGAKIGTKAAHNDCLHQVKKELGVDSNKITLKYK